MGLVGVGNPKPKQTTHLPPSAVSQALRNPPSIRRFAAMRGLLMRVLRPSKSSIPRASLRHPPLPPPSLSSSSSRKPYFRGGGFFSHETLTQEVIPGDFLKWATVGSQRGSRFAAGYTPLQPKPLDSIIDIERAKTRSTEDLVSIWDDFRCHTSSSLALRIIRREEHKQVLISLSPITHSFQKARMWC
ncbi:hypothetical protein COCNU_03G010800 [Cocos nucifera]|uniref:Uncharacterized protein n=1 Tax=Cocos nucifera TaxID=13894 RepID=A0A8K0MZH0_COCNU|nr:hypothetical protein COCNU_03G010800 [Cocos nucifera]